MPHEHAGSGLQMPDNLAYPAPVLTQEGYPDNTLMEVTLVYKTADGTPCSVCTFVSLERFHYFSSTMNTINSGALFLKDSDQNLIGGVILSREAFLSITGRVVLETSPGAEGRSAVPSEPR